MLPSSLPADIRRYKGSRQKKVRYRYAPDSRAGFIEMSPEWSQGPAKDVIWKFGQALLAVPGAKEVKSHPKGSKTQQKNKGNHYQEHNWVVFTERMGSTYLEFELARNGRTKAPDRNNTVSAMFRDQALKYVAEAWRILRGACLPNVLLPDIADWNHREALREFQDLQQPKEPAGSKMDTGFAMSYPKSVAPASPTGLKPDKTQEKFRAFDTGSV